MQLPEQGLFIAGQRTDATSGETFETINPATGEVICRVQHAGPEDVDRAVASAREGFEVWREMSGAERGRILNRAVALLRRHNEELARLEVADTGKPWQEAIAVDIHSGADA
ncbi:MAG TPA: aldehyde dehydrogenase family protein, partial [Acidimicrobiia bacterium]|nr:aldehyde dehydrogenase family protein [Acidimicrobiia bacterium]